MNYRRRNGMCNPPERAFVERVVMGLAVERELSASAVLAGRRREDISARHEAWRRILRQSGCSINGLAEVWGCDRQAIWRPLIRDAGLSTGKSKTCGPHVRPQQQNALREVA